MISAISYTPVNYNNYSNKSRKQPSFTAHPDFERLSQKYILTASSWFRRGESYGKPADEFVDVASTLQEVFKRKPHKKKSMLIIGVASSQEPFSYLSVVKKCVHKNPLDRSVDLNIVDMQSKPSPSALFKDSFLDTPHTPSYASNSFRYDKKHIGIFEGCHYRVKNEIYNFVQRTYDDSSKSKWDTRIQDVACTYPSNKFDIISVNNVLPYIYVEDKEVAKKTLKELKRSLKTGGYLITDPRKLDCMRDEEFLDHMVEVRKGIYRKI